MLGSIPLESMFKANKIFLIVIFILISVRPALSDVTLFGYHHLGDNDHWSPSYIPPDPVTYIENINYPIHFYLTEPIEITKVVLTNIVGLESDDNITVYIDGTVVGTGVAGSANITLSPPVSLSQGLHDIAFQGACYRCYWWGGCNKTSCSGYYDDIDDFYFDSILFKTFNNVTTQAINLTQKRHMGDNDDADDDYSDITDSTNPYYPDGTEGLSISYTFDLSSAASSLVFHFYRMREIHGTNDVYLDGNLIDSIDIPAGGSIPYSTSDYQITYIGNVSAGTHTLEIISGCLRWRHGRCIDYDNISWDELIIIPTYLPSIDYYEIWHDDTALTCKSTVVTVKACTDSGCTLSTDSSTVELATSSSNSDWAGTNPQTFTGEADYTLYNSANETLTLSISSATPSADYCCVINGSGAANCTAGDYSDCGITFYKSGFILDQVNATSCEDGHGTVRAVRTDDTTQACVPAFQNQSRKLLFWAQYDSPGSGTKQVSVNGTMVGPPASSAANVTLAFDSTGSAPFSVHYADAGRLWLGVNGTGNYTFMHGGGYLVFKPAKFSITSSMTNTALTGTPSLQAGRDFSLSLSAQCDNGTVTANYEGNATLWIEMANPSGASGGALQFLGKSYAVGAAGQNVTFSNGTASASNATFSDVGVFKIHVKDDDYFGQQVPEANETVGRFYPDHFRLDSSSITPGCGTFTYMEQPFTVSFVLRAEDYANSTTVNYDTALLGASITAEVGLYAEDADSGTPITSRISPAVSGNWTSGSFTFGGNFTFARQASPDGPYQVNIGVNATDQDSVPIQGADMDCSGGSCEAKLLDNNPQEFRYGHLDIYSNYGPETDNLTMGVAAVYWDGAGWSLNTADSCTSLNATDFVFSNWQDNLDPGETAISTGSVNGIGAGEGNFTLTAPGTGNWGSVDIGLNSTSSFYQWLSGGLNGTAFFGLYRGNDKVIHWFELR